MLKTDYHGKINLQDAVKELDERLTALENQKPVAPPPTAPPANPKPKKEK